MTMGKHNNDGVEGRGMPPPPNLGTRPEKTQSEGQPTSAGSKRRRKRKSKRDVHPSDPIRSATIPADGGDPLLKEMDAVLKSSYDPPMSEVRSMAATSSHFPDRPASRMGEDVDDNKPKRHASNSADNLVERRHLKECCEALGIAFKEAHLDFKDIPKVNDEGVPCDWPYRTLILYHNQGETLDSYKEMLMRYEESYLLITGLLMTVGFGIVVGVHLTDYWDVWDVATGEQLEEYEWFRMPLWDYVFKILFAVSALSSSLCSFKACTGFTSWFLAVSDTPADLVPVVISRYLCEYSLGRCANTWPYSFLLGGSDPAGQLFSSLWYLCLAMCTGIVLLGGPVAGGVLAFVVIIWYKPIKEAGYQPYPNGVGKRGTYSTALQWAIDRNYHKV